MYYNSILIKELGAKVSYSIFSSKNGVDELHVIINLLPSTDSFQSQKERIQKAENAFISDEEFSDAKIIFKRYFLSDAINQSPYFTKEKDYACSIIQQPPLNSSKISVWIYLVKNVQVQNNNDIFFFKHNNYTHFWDMCMLFPNGNSYEQTTNLLKLYNNKLNELGLNLKDNCIRTWFYVRDVDIQYMPMVKARREFFESVGMTKESHFISSTGIAGIPYLQDSIIQMGAYAVKGLQEGQIKFIKALSHLNPTHEYGVTFERGTSITYGDRRHIIISGTASINNKGEVVHVNDIVRQTHRMWENVNALLEEANASFENVMQIIVYLRDIADYNVVKKMFEKKFPNTPYVITHAPVCRPNWLIEMECIAIIESFHSEYEDF